MNLEALGGRKFLLTLLAFITATAVELCTERGITEWYAGLIIGLVGVYGATNVAITNKGISAGAPVEGAPVPEAVDLEPITSKLDALEGTLNGVAQNALTTSQLLEAAAKGQAAANRAAIQRPT